MMGWAGLARMGGIGDNLIAASVLRPLKRMGYKTEVITSPGASCVFLNNPNLDKLSVKDDGDIKGDWQQWFATRAKEYEVFANLSHSCEDRHALNLSKTAFWWSPEYRRKLCAGSYLETVHDIMGVPYDFGPLFFPTDAELERANNVKTEQIGGRYLSWVISGTRVDKTYPYAVMAICRIIKELDIPVVLIGSGDQQIAYAKQVEIDVKRTNSSSKNLHVAITSDNPDPGGSKAWPIRRSLTQAMISDLVVTPDTGVAWAVAMEAMPKIVMVSHASAENITSHWVNTTTLHADQNNVPCWPCHRLHDTIETCTPAKDGGAAACMADISVETIMENVERLWHAKPIDNVVRLVS